jgi:predicted ABC-type ATPase
VNENTAPRLLVIAGPNGSGKTTLTTRLREFGLDFGEYINADEIALILEKSPDRDRLAQLEADRRRRACLDGKKNYSFETVMSHPSKIDEMREAKTLGFYFTFYFVGVNDPEINLSRVKHRVQTGGHDVPSDRVVARYYRTMALMPEAILLADQSFVFDNSDVAAGPQLAAEFRRKGGEILLSDPILNATRNYQFTTIPWVETYVISGVKDAAAKAGVKALFP